MTKLIVDLKNQFPSHGQFNLKRGEKITAVVRMEQITNCFGIYVIFNDLDRKGDLIYIGKAGTINQDGTRKRQGLTKRLCAKQAGKRRNAFFTEYMRNPQATTKARQRRRKRGL